LKLARRERGVDARRLVECRISPAGLRLLAELDAPIEAANRRAVRSLDSSERRSLVRLLELVRDDA
jgi:DNA-binding MarR family transcriptional regulator